MSMNQCITYFCIYHPRAHYFFQIHFLYSTWMMGHYLETFGVVAEAKRHLFLLCILPSSQHLNNFKSDLWAFSDDAITLVNRSISDENLQVFIYYPANSRSRVQIPSFPSRRLKLGSMIDETNIGCRRRKLSGNKKSRIWFGWESSEQTKREADKNM